MPRKEPRNYKEEYKWHGRADNKRDRAARGRARTKLGLKKGDPREVDHKKPLKKGGTNGRNNLRIVSKKTNRKKGNKDVR